MFYAPGSFVSLSIPLELLQIGTFTFPVLPFWCLLTWIVTDKIQWAVVVVVVLVVVVVVVANDSDVFYLSRKRYVANAFCFRFERSEQL